MHLLEACLAWSRSTPIRSGAPGRRDRRTDPVALHPAGERHAARILRPGLEPRPGREGRICEPGHQFEWGWLLLRWGKLTGRADATAAALRMIEAGETHGIDVENGVAINALLDDFSVDDANARLWPQTERIKAAALAAEITGEPQWWAMAAAGAEGLMAYLRTPVPGIWRDKLQPNGDFIDEPAPASSFYHIVCAIVELDRAVNAAS
jgi:mannose/cellobiose epimerase-like protein (N-acyl-D-glucosamine 2-epimerase family)